MSLISRFLSLFRRSAENPQYALDSDEAYELLAGSKSDSGVSISRDSSLTYAPVWRAVNLISRDVAKLPLHVYRREGKGMERATEHPAFPILRHKVNPTTTSFYFRQMMQADVLLDGNAYAYVDRNGAGDPVGLIRILPNHVTPARENGQLVYVLPQIGRRIATEDMIHIKGLGFDGLTGYPVWNKARDSWGTGIAARQFTARYFKNGAYVKVVIEVPNAMSENAYNRLKQDWSKLHEGLDNAHKTAILEEGAKLNAFSHNARDAQLLELRAFEIRDVANWFGVPPHKLGDTTRTAYASLEQENQSYLDDALDGWLVAWEEELRDKLLTEREKREDTHVVEFLRQALVRADLKTRAEYYRAALGGQPWMMVNEARGLENMNPIPEGDVYRVPLNVSDQTAPASTGSQMDGGTMGEMDGNGGMAEEMKAKAMAAAEAVLYDAGKRMIRRLSVHITKAAKDAAGFRGYITKTLREDHAATISEALAPALTAYATVGAVEVSADAMARELVDLVAGSVLAAKPDQVAGVLEEIETNAVVTVAKAWTNAKNGAKP